MTFAPTANRLYGAGPPVAPVAGMPTAGNGRAMKSAAGAVPAPDAGAAPRAADSVSSLIDDPTFWLVATIGAALILASASA